MSPKLFFTIEASVPIRRSKAESSEMVSQLVFGDMCEMIEDEKSWVLIRQQFDGYEGWVDRKMLVPVDEDFEESISEWKMILQGGLIWEGFGKQTLPAGSWVPFSKGEKIILPGRKGRVWEGSEFWESKDEDQAERLVLLAKKFLNTPYLWGGCTSFGIDCSGLVQRVFRAEGKALPRDSGPQSQCGSPVVWEERQKGDLAFFSKPNQNRITHVGIICNEAYIIHASGRVRIDKLTEEGIIHAQNPQLTHYLESIRRC